MATLMSGYAEDGTSYDDPPDIEPDIYWKNELRTKIQGSLQHLVDEARRDRDRQWTHTPGDAHMNEIIQHKYEVVMTTIRRLAQEQYEEALERERQERRWTAGFKVDPLWINALSREQEMLMAAALQNGRQRSDSNATHRFQSEPPVAGPSRLSGRGASIESSLNHTLSQFAIPTRDTSNPVSDWITNPLAERHVDPSKIAGGSDVPWPRASVAPSHEGTIRQHHVDAQARAKQVPEIWRPNISQNDESNRSRPVIRSKPSVETTETAIRDRSVNARKRKVSQSDDMEIVPGTQPSITQDAPVVHVAETDIAILKPMNLAMARAALGQESGRRTPHLRPQHFAHPHHLVDRTQSSTPKPPSSFRIAPTPLRAVENIQFRSSSLSTEAYFDTDISAAVRASASTPHSVPRTLSSDSTTPMQTEQAGLDQKDGSSTSAMMSALRTSTGTPGFGLRAPTTSNSSSNPAAMQVVDPRSFTLDDDRSSINSMAPPPLISGRGRSDTLRASQPFSTSTITWGNTGQPETIIIQPSPQRTPTMDEMVLVASDEGDSDWEASAFDTEDVEKLIKEGMQQIMLSDTAELDEAQPSDSSSAQDQTPTEIEDIAMQLLKAVETETETEREGPQKKGKGGKGKRKEETKKKEQEGKQKAQDAKTAGKQKEQEEAKRKQAEETRRKQLEETKRKQEEARFVEEKKKEEEARRKEDEVKQMLEEAKKCEQLRQREEAAREVERLNEEKLQEFRRQQEDARRRAEGRQRVDSMARLPEGLKKNEVRKGDQDANKKDVEAGRNEETRRRDEDLKKREEEIRRKEEELARREQEIAKREKAEDTKRKEDDKRRKPGAPRKKEDELRDKERELQRQTAEIKMKEEELKRREEALNRQATEMLAKMKAMQEDFRRDWLRMGGMLS